MFFFHRETEVDLKGYPEMNAHVPENVYVKYLQIYSCRVNANIVQINGK